MQQLLKRALFMIKENTVWANPRYFRTFFPFFSFITWLTPLT